MFFDSLPHLCWVGNLKLFGRKKIPLRTLYHYVFLLESTLIFPYTIQQILTPPSFNKVNTPPTS